MNLSMRVRATARVEAVAPERGETLVQFLKAYRDAVQYVVDRIWSLEKTPSTKQLHRMFYNELRRYGFRAHHVSEIYKRAKEVVEATKRNSGSKPVLKKLTARIHPLDYRIDLNAKTLRIAVLNDEWIELRLKWYKYLDKYLDNSWRVGEIQISCYRDDKVFVYITFIKAVLLKEPKAVMGVDINFTNITYAVVDLNDNLVATGVIPFKGLRRVLHLKKLAEDLQKRYPKSWRFIKWVRRARAKWLRRARSILNDSSHYIAKKVIGIAKEYNALIVLEDLEKLKEKANGDRFSWEKQMWCYRRIQSFVEYKALIEGIEVVYVDPRRSSKESPNGKPLKFINYRFVELGDVVTSRDVVASWNIALRGLKRMRGSWVTWSPDSPANEGMKTRPNAGNPEARRYLQIFTTHYK
jgi:putative transposase